VQFVINALHEMSGHHFHFGYLLSEENIHKLIAAPRLEECYKLRKVKSACSEKKKD